MDDSPINNIRKSLGHQKVSTADEPEISELVTSYLDGEVSGSEAVIARKTIQESPEIRREAQDIQRAWDLLDFLPLTVSPEAKTLETLAMVLRESNSRPGVPDNSGHGEKNSDQSSRLGWGPIHEQEKLGARVPKSFWYLAFFSGVLGACFGLLTLGAWRHHEAAQAEKMKQVIGVVENIQILREGNDLDFLQGIAVPELFGQPDSPVAP